MNTKSKKSHPKFGVIDTGGGLRGIYGAGVLDYCMDNDLQFDLCCGVSAGAANLISYQAGQSRRNLMFYLDYAFRKEYMSMDNFLKSGSYLNLDYIYGTLTNAGGENPLDFSAVCRNPSVLTIVSTNAETGRARYFDKSEMETNHYDILKATCAIPVVCRPQVIDGNRYFDGALSDPVPIRYALDSGCDKVVLILTKPQHHLKPSKADKRLSLLIRNRYPEAAKDLKLRAVRYAQGVKYVQQLEQEGRALIVSPESIEGMSTLTKDRKALMDLYLNGYKGGERIRTFLEQAS